MKKLLIRATALILTLMCLGSCREISCVSEGTFIATPSGAKLVERLQLGDVVLSPDPLTNRMYTGTVVALL